MISYVAVFIGGGAGALARYLLTLTGKRMVELAGSAMRLSTGTTNSLIANAVALSTLVINLVGCFVIGLAFGAFERRLPSPELRLFLMTGFLGGFTTFSTFALELATAIRSGRLGSALAVALISNIGGIALVVVGSAIGDGMGKSTLN